MPVKRSYPFFYGWLHSRWPVLAFSAAILWLPGTVLSACFTNSLMQGQDPSVVLKDGLFHLVQSDGCAIRLRRSNTLGNLASADDTVIYSPGCRQVWAPELHFLSNRWYLYYTLNTNLNSNGRARRGFVAESQGTDAAGPYADRGILFPDFWNIDGNVFSWDNRLFYTFSGEPVQGAQCIYIAPMSNPYTLSGPPVLISAPAEPWETIGFPEVNEGPWGFTYGGRLFLVYSASGCWTDDYALGLLTLTGSDPLDMASWTKSGPVFTKKAGAYGPGHNSVVQDTAGQWWNVYHANVNSGEGCGGLRRIRAQRLFWNNNGEPDFGSPLSEGSVLTESPDFQIAHFALVETAGSSPVNAVCGSRGTVNGVAEWTNPGLNFNGTNSYVDCGWVLGNDVQHQLTLAAWLCPEELVNGGGIITKGTNTSPYSMQTTSDGSIQFSANRSSPPGAAGDGSWNSTAKVAIGQWQHVAVTYDGTHIRFYINGVVDAYQPQVNLRFGIIREPLTIGADLPEEDEFFKGRIRGARVYGRALTGEELSNLENYAPQLAPYTNASVVAGSIYSVPSHATDPNLPPQKLTFRLISGPFGATVNSFSGGFSWRPSLSQAPSTNLVRIAVSDSGAPSLSATQAFTITVRRPVPPVTSSPRIEDSIVRFEVNGDAGPAYAVLSSADFLAWTLLFTTNPVSLPFGVALPVSTNAPRMFYRVENR